MHVFVTGATGHIGSAVLPELLSAGHEVTGLARSDAGAAALTSLGARVRRSDLDDLDGLREAAAAAEGVIHLAFKHEEMQSGDLPAAMAAEMGVIQALGDALEGSGKALISSSGGNGGATGRAGTEQDVASGGPRADAEKAVLALADRGVRAVVVRNPLIVHSTLDRHGIAWSLIRIARAKGVSAYVGDGANRWPAVHTLDTAHLYRLALESSPAGAVLHAAAEEGIAFCDIAAAIGRGTGLPTATIAAEEAADHFGPFLGQFVGRDVATSSEWTRKTLDWNPTHIGLIEELAQGHYFA